MQTDLSFVLRGDGRRIRFSKAAFVDFGPVPSAEGCEAEIGWRAASWAPLFPVFAGRLVVRGDGLLLDGYYSPPGGGIGLLIDRVLLHHVAARTARWLLERLASQVTHGVE